MTLKELLFNFIRTKRWLVTLVVLSVTFSNIIRVIIPLSIGYFYKINYQDTGGKLHLLRKMGIRMQTNEQYLTFVIILILLFALFYFIQLYFGGKLSEIFASDLRDQLFYKQLNGSLEMFEKEKLEKNILRYGSEMKSVSNFISKGIFVFVGDIVYALFMFLVFYSMSPVIAISIFVLYLMVLLGIHFLNKSSRPILNAYSDAKASLLQYVHQQFHDFYLIKSFNKETATIRTFTKKNRRVTRSHQRKLWIDSFQNIVIRSSLFLSIFLVLLIIVLFEKDQIDKGDVLVSTLLLLYFQSTVRRIMQTPSIWSKGKESITKILTILNQPHDRREKLHELEIKGQLQFKEVSYCSQDSLHGIQNVNFSCSSNAINQIITKSHSQSLRLIKLCQHIISPETGWLIMDGMNYEDLSPFELRRHISIVSDECKLRGQHLFEAVAYRPSEDRKERILDWLRKIQYPGIETNKEILHLPLSKHGENLTKEEYKLLQYVKAFASSKKIILIYEPFDFLSTHYKHIIANQLNQLSRKRTIILFGKEETDLLFCNNKIYI